MRTKETSDFKEEKWRVALAKSEAANADLSFVIEKLKEDLRGMEKKYELCASRLEQSLSKSYMPSAYRGLEDPELPESESNAIGRAQDFEMSRTLAPGASRQFGQAKSDLNEDLRRANERLHLKEEEIQSLHDELNRLMDDISRNKLACASRDKEIERLTDLIGQGTHVHALPTRNQAQQQSSTISELNEKLDFLNAENRKLEDENKRAKVRLAGTAKIDDQVDSLYLKVNKLKAKNQDLQEKLKESTHLQEIEHFRREVSSRDREIATLQNQVSSLDKENAELVAENERAAQVKAAYSSDKKAFSEVVERLTNESNSLKEEIREISLNHDKLGKEYKNLQDALELSETQVHNLKHEIQVQHKHTARINQENSSISEDFHALSQQVLSLQSKISLLNNENRNSSYEIQKAIKQKEALESSNAQLIDQITALQQEISSIGTHRQKIQIQLDTAYREIETLRLENESLVKMREGERHRQISNEEKLKDIHSQLLNAQDQLKFSHSDKQHVLDELSEKAEALAQSNQKAMILEREVSELRPLARRVADLETESKIYREKNNEIEFENMRIKKDLEDSKSQIASLQYSLDRKESALKAAQEEISISMSQITSDVPVASSDKKIEFLETELSLLKDQLTDSRNKERELFKEIETLRSSLLKAEDAKISAEKQTERVSQSAKSLDAQLTALYQTHSATNSLVHKQTSQIAQLEEKTRVLNSDSEDLRRQVLSLQSENGRLKFENKEQYRSLLEEQLQVKRLNDQITQLKSLNASIENTRNEITKRLEQANFDKIEKQDEIERLNNELSHANNKLLSSSNKITELVAEREELIRKNDELGEAVRTKNEETEKLKNELRSDKKELSEFRTSYKRLEESNMLNSTSLMSQDSEMQRLNVTITELTRSLSSNELKSNQDRNSIMNLQEANRDLSKENEKLVSKIESLSSEKREMSAKLSDYEQVDRKNRFELQQTQEHASSYSLKLDSILREKDSMSSYLEEVKGKLRDSENKAKISDGKLEALTKELQDKELIADSNAAELKALQQELSSMRLKLSESERGKHEAEKAKNELLFQVSSTSEIATVTKENREDLERKLVEIENEKVISESKLRVADSELRNTKNQIDLERHKYADLEHVLMKEREMMRKLQEELRQADAKSMSYYTSPPAHDTRSDIVKLEMENARIKEELRNTQFALFKAENKF